MLDQVVALRRARRVEGRRLRALLVHERAHWEAGRARVVGVDEVGLGPMAGPLCAGAVILPAGTRGARLVGIDDSKRLTAEQRRQLVPRIEDEAVAWSLGWVEPSEIDAVGLHRANLLAMERAVAGLGVAPDAALVDGRHLPALPVDRSTAAAIVKGDQLSMSIAAASVLAKVARDRVMTELAERWPGYGFEQHKGYPVPEHKSALARLGPSPIHRRCFALVRDADAAVAGRDLRP